MPPTEIVEVNVSLETLEEINLMNEAKELAIKCGQLCEKIGKTPADQRWLAIAKTELQKSFMFLIRSVAKPETF